MTILTRDTILAAQDLARETVPTPEWGGSVIVQAFTGAKREAFTGRLSFGPDGKLETTGYRASLLVYALVDEQGQPLFTEGDIAALSEKSSAVLDRLFTVAERLNAIGAQALEAAAKN